MDKAVIERIADPLPGGRAQLVETLFADGGQVYSVRCGSPARAEVVREYEETLTITVEDGRVQVTRKAGR